MEVITKLSISYLSLPIYIAVCILLSGSLLFAAYKRINKDRKGLIFLYVTVAMGPLLAIVGKIIQDKYSDYFGIASIFVIAIIIVELIFLAITHKGTDKSSKRLIIIGFLIIIISMFPLLIFLINE